LKKEIFNFPGYFADSEGFIQGKRCARLKGKITWDGYEEIILVDGNKRRSVRTHILIAETFILKPEGKHQVNHKDGIKLNNRLENLEYVSGYENVRHAVRTGNIKTKGKTFSHLSMDEITSIFVMHRQGKSYKEIKNYFGLHCRQDYIGELLTGRKLCDLTKELRSETIETTA